MMRRTAFIFMLSLLAFLPASAQRITHQYNNVPLSEALLQLNSLQSIYTVNFIYNELDDFRVTTDVNQKSVPDAIQQLIGFYPVSMTVNDETKEIFIECTHKTERHFVGTVIDEHEQPLPYANVALLNPQDSAFLCGGVSNESGYFAIPYVQDMVLARITYVGYQTVYRLCKQPEVGIIRMKPDNYTINGVVVKGEIPQYQMTTGGMTVRVAGTLLSQMGTATDVLGQLPRVSTTADGGIIVYGKGTPLIYINNRQVRDNKELTQLKSENIKSIEVITTPGAQYDATVESVIRIRTVRRMGEAFSLTTESNVENNSHWKGYEDLTLKYSTEQLEVMVNGFYMHSWRGENNHLSQDFYALEVPVEVHQVMMKSQPSDNLYGEASLTYDFNDSISVGVTYDMYGYFNKTSTGEGVQQIWENGRLSGSINGQEEVSITTGPNHNLDAYLTAKWGCLSIDFNGTCFWQRELRNDLTVERSAELSDRDVHTDMIQHNRMQAAKLVLSYPVLKGTLSLGTESTHTHTQGSYSNVEGYVSNSETNIRESNTALFAEYRHSLGDFELRTGLRYEHVNSRYYSFDELQPDLSHRYDQWFPNMSLSWNKGKWGVQLNYNRRTQRPSYWALRNFLQYDNRYTFEGGNPQLRPQIYHGLELDAKYDWFSLQANYTYYQNSIIWFTELDYTRNVSVTCNRNFNHYRSIYLSLSASPKFGFYQPTWDVHVRRAFFDVGQYGTQFEQYKPVCTLNLRNRFIISKSTTATLNLFGETRQYDGFIVRAPQLQLSASLVQTFFNKTLTLRLYANNLLKTDREKWTMYGKGVNLFKDCYNYTRHVGLTVTYNLNPTRSKYKGTGAGNDEKNRL